jgi:hypothetical protein
VTDGGKVTGILTSRIFVTFGRVSVGIVIRVFRATRCVAGIPRDLKAIFNFLNSLSNKFGEMRSQQKKSGRTGGAPW